jgi:hypothetical protein
MPNQTGGKNKKAIIIAAVTVVVLIGITFGGHFLGLYNLPFLPDRVETEEVALLPDNSPSSTVTPPEAPPPEEDVIIIPPAEASLFGTWTHIEGSTVIELMLQEDGRYYTIAHEAGNYEMVFIEQGWFTVDENMVYTVPEFGLAFNSHTNEIIDQNFVPEPETIYFTLGEDTLVISGDGFLSELAAGTPSGLWSFGRKETLHVAVQPFSETETFMGSILTATEYHNAFLDLSFVAPAGYIMMNREGLDAQSTETTSFEMFVTNSTNTYNLSIAVEKLALTHITEIEYLEFLRQPHLTQIEGYDVNEPAFIAGRYFYVIDFTSETYNQSYCVRKIDDYMLVIIVTSAKDANSYEAALNLLFSLQPHYGW